MGEEGRLVRAEVRKGTGFMSDQRDNWVERRWAREQMLPPAYDKFWSDLVSALKAACQSFKPHFGNQNLVVGEHETEIPPEFAVSVIRANGPMVHDERHVRLSPNRGLGSIHVIWSDPPPNGRDATIQIQVNDNGSTDAMVK